MAIFSGSLRRNFLLNGVVTTLLIALVAAIGWWSTASLKSAIDDADVASQALRNHMTADMMHDALRGDALAAIEAGMLGSEPEKAASRADLAQHVATLRENVRANQTLALPKPLADALAALDGPLDAYADAASKIVALGVVDPAAARRQMPAFLSAFTTLEGVMDTAGDQIERHVSQSAAANRDLAATATTAMAVALVLGALAGVVANILLNRAISPPISAMTNAMERLAAGDVSVETPSTARRDEIGAMAKAVEVFKRNAIAMRRMEAEEVERKALTEERRRADMRAVADRFEAEVLGVAASVSASAEQLRQNADMMRSVADVSNGASTAVAAAAEETTVNMQSVAGAASQLSAAIQEIAQQVTAAAGSTSKASGEARASVALVERLAVAVTRIGHAVTLIGDVSAQTNLLALNATIEAARAGEAGRGFAIVASEVKQLAEQSARASEEIGGHIEEVRSATAEMVKSIGAIDGSIRSVDEIAAAISAAVEEQGVATQEIASSVRHASVGATEMSSNIANVADASGRTGEASREIVAAAGALAQQAESLKRQVAGFIAQVRAA